MRATFGTIVIIAALLGNGCTRSVGDLTNEQLYIRWVDHAHKNRKTMDSFLKSSVGAGYYTEEYDEFVRRGETVVPYLVSQIGTLEDPKSVSALDSEVTAILVAKIMQWDYEELLYGTNRDGPDFQRVKALFQSRFLGRDANGQVFDCFLIRRPKDAGPRPTLAPNVTAPAK